MSKTLEINGTRQPQSMKASSDIDELIRMNAILARITPTGAPACA
jgi:hypothetical protein